MNSVLAVISFVWKSGIEEKKLAAKERSLKYKLFVTMYNNNYYCRNTSNKTICLFIISISIELNGKIPNPYQRKNKDAGWLRSK